MKDYYAVLGLTRGAYSIAEVVYDSCKTPEKTVLCVLRDDEIYRFSDQQWKSLLAVVSMVSKNGSKVFTSLEEVATELNSV